MKKQNLYLIVRKIIFPFFFLSLLCVFSCDNGKVAELFLSKEIIRQHDDTTGRELIEQFVGGLDGTVYSLAPAGTRLHVGGDFQRSSTGVESPYWITVNDGVLAVVRCGHPSGRPRYARFHGRAALRQTLAAETRQTRA